MLSDNQHAALRTASFHRRKGNLTGFLTRIVAIHDRATPAQREALLAELVTLNAVHLFDFDGEALVGADLSRLQVAA